MMTACHWRRIATALCLLICASPSGSLRGQDGKITAKEVVAKHLRSIGKPEDLARIKSRGMSGKAAVQFIQGATGLLNDGQFLCVSEGRNLGMVMKFGDNNYPGEYFAFNGQETTVGHITPGQRSPLADFLFRYNAVMKEGLLGGVLSVTWPLLKPSEEQPEMVYRQEQIGVHTLHMLEYGSDLGDVKVKLYFDPKTFRHVRTEYRVRLANDSSALDEVVTGVSPGGNPTGLGRPAALTPKATIQDHQPDSIYVMVEKFSNFANVGGLILPQDYSIDYSVEGHGASFVARWAVLIEHWKNNGEIDQSFFVAQK